MEEVCSGESLECEDVLDVLSRLVDKSLVVVAHDGAAYSQSNEARYRMLQTVRQYALEKLNESGEEEEVRGRHAGFFLALAEEADPELRGPRQVAWMKRLGAENDNLRTTLRWLLSKAEWEMVARLGWALWWFWWLPGRFTEGRRWMEEALEKGAMPVSARAKVLFTAGVMAAGQDDHRTAQPRIEESLRLFEELEDKRGAAFALGGASLVAIGQGRIEEGLAFLEKSGNLFMEVGDKWGAAAVHSFSATVWLALGDHGRAERVAERGLELSREVGDAGVVGTPLYILASLAHAAGDNVRARGMFGEAVEIGAQVWDWSNVAYCMEGLASVAASEGGMERAARLGHRGGYARGYQGHGGRPRAHPLLKSRSDKRRARHPRRSGVRGGVGRGTGDDARRGRRIRAAGGAARVTGPFRRRSPKRPRDRSLGPRSRGAHRRRDRRAAPPEPPHYRRTPQQRLPQAGREGQDRGCAQDERAGPDLAHRVPSNPFVPRNFTCSLHLLVIT